MNIQQLDVTGNVLIPLIERDIVDHCCIIKNVRKTIYNVFNILLTREECIYICLYYYISMIYFTCILISYNIVYIWFNCYFTSFVIITLGSNIINMIFISRMLDNIKDIIRILHCSCNFYISNNSNL